MKKRIMSVILAMLVCLTMAFFAFSADDIYTTEEMSNINKVIIAVASEQINRRYIRFFYFI